MSEDRLSQLEQVWYGLAGLGLGLGLDRTDTFDMRGEQTAPGTRDGMRNTGALLVRTVGRLLLMATMDDAGIGDEA